jgi:uncharacterized protein (TIGR03437 family)
MKTDSPLRKYLGVYVFLTLLSGVCLNAQAPSFVNQNQFAVGANPNALIFGSFNNGARPDLLVLNEGDSTLSVLQNLGNGFFAPFTIQPAGVSPRAVVAGDFNRDGKLDLAIADFVSNTVTVSLGSGAGTFRLFQIIQATGPVALGLADFNGDGKLDLAIVEQNSNSVSVYLGDGTGSFVSASATGTGDRPVSIVVADFNHDGRLDLAVANSGSNDVSILLGNGNGTFQSAVDFDAGQLPAYLAVGDFNGDRILDLAVADATGFSSGTISVLLGFGNGFFQAPRSFPAGANPTFLVTGDFNVDGIADLAVANTGSDTISIFLGIGNGFFLAPLDFAVGNAPDWITLADVNGDGTPDLLVANGQSNTVSVLISSTGAPSQPVIASAVNAASLQYGPLVPGELMIIFGSNLGPEVPVGAQLTSYGQIGTTLAQTQVVLDGTPAPLLYVSAGEVNFVVPYSVAGLPGAQMVVRNAIGASAALTIPVTDSAPAIFTLDPTGQAAVVNQDGSVNGVMNPAARGSVVALYATGAGQTNPPGIDGLITMNVLPEPLLPVAVTIDGQAAKVLYAGGAPGLVSGVLQVNISVPATARTGTVPVVLQVGPAKSQPRVTLSLK